MSGIEHIINMIIDKAVEKEREIIEEAEKYRRERLQLAKDKAQQRSQAEIEKAQKEAEAILERHAASLKLQRKHRILKTKEKIIKEVLEKALEESGKAVEKPEYTKIIERLVIEGTIALGEKEIELVFPSDQNPKFNLNAVTKEVEKQSGKKVSIKISDDTVRSRGGVIIRVTDGTKWVDNTIEARLERFEDKIRDKISSELF